MGRYILLNRENAIKFTYCTSLVPHVSSWEKLSSKSLLPGLGDGFGRGFLGWSLFRWHGQTRIQRFVLVRIEMGLKFWGQTVLVPQPLILFWGFALLLKSYLLMNKTWLLQLSFIFGSKTTSLGRVISHFDSLRRPSMQYVYLFTYCIIT